MDSMNIIKGYDKVSDQENQFPNPPKPATSKPKAPLITTTIAVAATLLLTLIIVAFFLLAASAFFHHPPSDSTDSIKTVCSVTRYPDSCFSSLSSFSSNGSTIHNPDPEYFFKNSLSISITQLTNLSMSFGSVKSGEAVKDCLGLFDEAASRLADSMSAMNGEGGLTDDKVKDAMTWISGAMTDVETCSDGLEEMGWTVDDSVKGEMQKSKEFMSNSLAILANLDALLHKFHSTMH